MTLPDFARLSEAGGAAFFDPFALHARLDFDFRDRNGAENGPILVHEYTHYLQSVSTVYGLYRVIDWIRTGVRLASVLPSLPQIRIPLQYWWDCPEPLRAQMADISIRLKLNDDLEQARPLENVSVEAFGPLHVARVKFSDDEPHIMAVAPIGDGMAIPIGARALAEGMAASTQRMWENEPRLDAVLAALEPQVAGWYTATRTIVREFVGSDQDLDFINALVCDAAMMTRNPPASFIAAVAAIAGSRATTKDAAVAAVRDAIPEFEEEIAYTREDIVATLGRLGEEEPFAKGIRRLLTSSLELLERRAAQPAFPVNVLCGDHPDDLEPLLLQYPLPCYFRGDRLLSWHDDEILANLGEDLLMLEHAMRILLFGTRHGSECPLTPSRSCQAPKTILCSIAPWRVDVDVDGMLCAFGNAMATFGAIGKVTEKV